MKSLPRQCFSMFPPACLQYAVGLHEPLPRPPAPHGQRRRCYKMAICDKMSISQCGLQTEYIKILIIIVCDIKITCHCEAKLIVLCCGNLAEAPLLRQNQSRLAILRYAP